MSYPGDAWMVAFVFTPIAVLALAGISVLSSIYAARKHDAKRAAESKEFCDRMSGKR